LLLYVQKTGVNNGQIKNLYAAKGPDVVT